MGILNCTPDSFYDGGKYDHLENAVKHALSLVADGADLLDIGGESSRPGSTEITVEEEKKRVLPLLKELTSLVSIPLSIDTRHFQVAEKALELGVSWINDITGFECKEMRRLGAESGAKVVVMHMQGTPETMQKNPFYKEGIVSHLLDWFKQRVDLLLKSGIREENIVLDPGIGFGKTVEDNLLIFKNLHRVKTLGFPLLIGASRKSFLGKILRLPNEVPRAPTNREESRAPTYAEELLAPTLAAHFFRYPGGADILRVHDVKEHVYMRAIMEALT